MDKMLATLVDQIKKEDDPGIAINYLGEALLNSHRHLAGTIENSEKTNQDQHDAIRIAIEEIRIAVLGNGHPEKSLMSKVIQNADKIKGLIWGVMLITGVVVGWIVNTVLQLIPTG